MQKIFSTVQEHSFRHYMLLGVFHTEMYVRANNDQAHLNPGLEFAGMARALYNRKIHGDFTDNIPDFDEAVVYAAAYYSQN